MLFPNKLFTYEESVLSKFPAILNALQTKTMSIIELYRNCCDAFSGVSEYVEVLDCLYALGKIRINAEREVEVC